MTNKQRLSVTVDRDLLRAAEDAASRGDAANVSAWVNDALRLKLAHERRLRALAGFIHAYEAENGVITDEEIARARRAARERLLSAREGARRPKSAAMRRRRNRARP